MYFLCKYHTHVHTARTLTCKLYILGRSHEKIQNIELA